MGWLQDKDKNGYVDVDELTNLHSTTKERLTMLEAKKILEVRCMRMHIRGVLEYRSCLLCLTRSSPGMGECLYGPRTQMQRRCPRCRSFR